MTRLSASPSGSRRRLSELLEEQQEPFSLNLYLLDKGCSPVLLDAAAGGSDSATTACWPKRRRSSSALRRRMVVPSKRTPTKGLLRLILSKILHGTTAAAANCKKKKKLQPAAMDCSPVDAVLSPPQFAVEADRNEADQEEEDADAGSSKQLSPVSVLEQSTFEQTPKAYAQSTELHLSTSISLSSPPLSTMYRAHAAKTAAIAEAVVIFRELMDAAYKPALLDELAKDNRDSKSRHGRNETSTTTAAPAPTTRTDRTTGAAAHWEEMFEAELAKVHDLIASDMAGAKVWPGDVRPEEQRWDVGCDVAVAVLEALTEEIAVELMGMDHDDAIDNGGRSGCC